MRKLLLVTAVFVALLIPASTTTFTRKACAFGPCPQSWIDSCYGAAQDRFNACLAAGLPWMQCSNEKYAFFETCINGLGCDPIITRKKD